MSDLGSVTLGTNQQVPVTFAPADASGNPVAGVVIAASGFDASLLSVAVAADNLSAMISANGPVGGPSTVTFSGTNADGSAVPDTATVAVTVAAAGAVTLGAKLGTVQNKP